MAKVDPYLRPLYDALYDMVEAEGAQRLLERGTVEVAPLAFMRGRTLNGSFIILDEAQNTTPEQMKMFLTRIGFGSKAVITGDTTQVDVAGGRSGVAGLEPVLHGIEGLSFVHLSSRDVVRHRIVQDIVNAYERAAPDPGPPTASDASSGPPRAARARAVSGATARWLTVFVADEQDAQPVDGVRWGGLAERVLAAEGVRGDVELSLLFVDRVTITTLNRDFMGADGPTDVLSFPIDGELAQSGRWPDDGGRRTRPPAAPTSTTCPYCWATSWCAPTSRPTNAPDHAGTYRRRDRPAGRARHPPPVGPGPCRPTTSGRPCRPASAICSSGSTARRPAIRGPGGARDRRLDRVVVHGGLDGDDVVLLVTIVVLLVASLFLALAETALTRMTRTPAPRRSPTRVGPGYPPAALAGGRIPSASSTRCCWSC